MGLREGYKRRPAPGHPFAALECPEPRFAPSPTGLPCLPSRSTREAPRGVIGAYGGKCGVDSSPSVRAATCCA